MVLVPNETTGTLSVFDTEQEKLTAEHDLEVANTLEIHLSRARRV